MSPRALAATLPKITKAVLEKGGRDYAAVIAEWPEIVGPQLAASSLPEKLVRGRDGASGTLHLRVTSGAAMEFQHREPQIIERINAYLGRAAVQRLRLVQGPLPGRKAQRRTTAPVLTPTEEKRIESTLTGVADEELRRRLTRFGRALAGAETKGRGEN